MSSDYARNNIRWLNGLGVPSALLVSSINDLKDAHIMHDVALYVQPIMCIARHDAPLSNPLPSHFKPKPTLCSFVARHAPLNPHRYVFEGKKRSLFEDASGSSRRSNSDMMHATARLFAKYGYFRCDSPCDAATGCGCTLLRDKTGFAC